MFSHTPGTCRASGPRVCAVSSCALSESSGSQTSGRTRYTALEWLLSRVDPLVYLQQRDMRKFLWAVGVGVGMGRGTDMTPLVSGECLLAAALLATLLTHKTLHSMISHVGCKR